MHEFSICQMLVDAVVAEMDKIEAPRPFRLVRARVVVGALRQIVPDILTFAYEIIAKDTPARGSTLEIVSAPAAGKCNKCGWTGEIRDVFFQCGECGYAGLELTGGTELYLDNLEIEPDE
jgi:hydrogenase nickel incorporation protein HypA/HybF